MPGDEGNESHEGSASCFGLLHQNYRDTKSRHVLVHEISVMIGFLEAGGVLEHTLGSLAVTKITKGLQAMKTADAEEAPAMKSMKAMKARRGSIQGRLLQDEWEVVYMSTITGYRSIMKTSRTSSYESSSLRLP